jgi:hypothetical protein
MSSPVITHGWALYAKWSGRILQDQDGPVIYTTRERARQEAQVVLGYVVEPIRIVPLCVD